MEACHHAGQHIDSERDPRTSGGLAGGLVDNHDIDLRVVDLYDLKRPSDLIRPGRCDVRTNQARLASAGGTSAFVDEKQPGLDGSPGRHGKTLLPACRCNVPNDTPQRRSGRL